MVPRENRLRVCVSLRVTSIYTLYGVNTRLINRAHLPPVGQSLNLGLRRAAMLRSTSIALLLTIFDTTHQVVKHTPVIS